MNEIYKILAVLSALAVIILFPDGLKATLEISPLCPNNCAIHYPEWTLYSLPVVSAETVTNLVP